MANRKLGKIRKVRNLGKIIRSFLISEFLILPYSQNWKLGFKNLRKKFPKFLRFPSFRPGRIWTLLLTKLPNYQPDRKTVDNVHLRICGDRYQHIGFQTVKGLIKLCATTFNITKGILIIKYSFKWAIPEKIQTGVWGVWEYTFLKIPLDIFIFLLYSCKFQTKQSSTSGYSTKLC